MRTSAAIAPLFVANTGFKSSSAISGKSATSRETFTIIAASAARSTGSAPRTPFSISAAAIPSSIDSASSVRRRREPEGDVLQHLDEYAAQPERDELAEHRVGDGADDHLLAAEEHLLHLHALERSRRRCIATRWP